MCRLEKLVLLYKKQLYISHINIFFLATSTSYFVFVLEEVN